MKLSFFVIFALVSDNVFAQAILNSKPSGCYKFYKQANKNRNTKALSLNRNTRPEIKVSEDESVVGRLSGYDFDRFSKYVSDPSYSSFVKFVIELNASGAPLKAHFFDTNKFPYHSQFLKDRLEPGKSQSQIDDMTLVEGTRKYLLGTFLRINDHDDFSKPRQYTVDLITNEVLKAEKAIEAMSFLGQSIQEIAVPSLLVSRKSKDDYQKKSDVFLQAKVALRFEDLLAGNFEIYSAGWAVGRLRVMTSDEYQKAFIEKTLLATDILVVDEAPRELPRVAGVIVQKPSTPSSHLALLSQMYQIPFAYDREALKKYSSFHNQDVFFSAEKGIQDAVPNLDVQKILPGDFGKISKVRPTNKFVSAAINVTESQIVRTQDLDFTSIPAYGAKAAGLGFLQKTIPDNSALSGVGIPIHYYARFLSEARTVSGLPLREALKSHFERLKVASVVDRGAVLSDIRKLILESEVPDSILRAITDAISRYFGAEPMKLKFRSSSNIEDLKGFNGAGLYDSKGAKWPDKLSVSLALKTVWSSVFNERAFQARQVFGIDESSVGMGILVQASFKGELANGVAILKKDTGDSVKSEITGFPGEDLEVTAAPPGVVPETMFVFKSGIPEDPSRLELKNRSTEVSPGRLLLLEDEYSAMTNLMHSVFNLWPKDRMASQGLDFEWKVMSENGQRKIYFKQVRPVPSPLTVPEKSMIVLGGQYRLDLQVPESDDGVVMHYLPKTLFLEMNTLSLDALNAADSKKWVSKVYAEGAKGRTELKVLSIAGSLEIQNHSGDPDLVRKSLNLKVTLEHLQFGKVELQAELPYVVDKESGTLTPVLNPAIHSYALSVSTKGWPLKASSPQVFTQRYAKTNDQLDRKFEDGQFVVSSADQSIRVNFDQTTPLEGQYQKTFFTIVKKAKIWTPATGEFEVDGRGITYAPAHHNFSWAYVIDLGSILGKSPQEIESIKAKLGSLIQIKKETESLLYFEHFEIKGEQKPIFKVLKKIKALETK